MSFIEGNHESKKDAILFGGAHLFYGFLNTNYQEFT